MIEGLAYIENFLSLEEEPRILDQIRALTFYHDIFRGRQLRSAYAQLGLRYGSTGRRLEPCAPFPEFLDELKRKLTGFCPAEEPLNQRIIAHYPPWRRNRLAHRCSGFRQLHRRDQPRRTGAVRVSAERY